MNTISLFSKIPASERVDPASGLIKGVSVVTKGEAEGHNIWIDDTMLNQVVGCGRSGSKVKMNHGTGAESIVGILKHFEVSGEQVIADLQLLKSAQQFPVIVEMAQTLPQAFGLSISFSGVFEDKDGKKYARCSKLNSVDIVDSPAANPTGLFSSKSLTNTQSDISIRLSTSASQFILMSAAERDAFCMGRGLISKSEFDKFPTAALKADFFRKGGRLSDLPLSQRPRAEVIHPPPPRPGFDRLGNKLAFAQDGEVKTYAAFSLLTPAEKMEFCRAGGRII